MGEKFTMTVELPGLTAAQAIALEAMFLRWRELGSIGSSRMVSFYADGDGNFRPKPIIGFSSDPYPANLDEAGRAALRKKAEAAENSFDFDNVAWSLHP